MKNLNHLPMSVILFTLIFLIPGCGSNENEDTTASLSVSVSSISMSSAAGTMSFDLKSNTKWNLLSQDSWLNYNPENGENNSSIMVTVEKNPTTLTRTGTLNINGTGTQPIVISVIQEGGSEQHQPEIDYLALGGEIPTIERAILFAPGIITNESTNERVVSIAPNGMEIHFTRLSNTGPRIYISKYNNKWEDAIEANYSLGYPTTEPSISPDGSKVFFISSRPPSNNPDIWVCKRLNNKWSSAELLGQAINTDEAEWHPSVTASGDLYFASEKTGGFGGADLYFSRFQNGNYTPNQNIGQVINTISNEWDPYVDPEGKYIIFKSDRPGGYGGMDNYITLNKNGEWSTPKNLGPIVNSSFNDDAADVTPDGKYLVFMREDAKGMNIYWVDMGAINHLMTP